MINDVYYGYFQIEDIVGDLNVRLESCESAITKTPSLDIEDILKNAQQLFDKSKRIPTYSVSEETRTAFHFMSL